MTAQPGEPSPARGDVEEVSRSLLRVVTLLARYTQDTTTRFTDIPQHTPAPSGPWSRARAQTREALTNAAALLARPSGGRPLWPGPRSASPLARRLDQIATLLAAGRDLLHTHFAPAPGGGRAAASHWAAALTGERVNRALLAEIGALAHPIARHGANVALAPIPGTPANADQRRALNAACQWLWALASSIHEASNQEPVPAADQDLLAAIPANILPTRPQLAAAQTVPALCDGAIATAERLRHLAWHTAQQPPWAPALTVTSLRQAAETSTLTGHHCALLTHALTQRQPGAYPLLGPDLAGSARAARQASAAWYQTARALRQLTTDTRGLLTPAAAEARDLAIWTGRLAHTDPDWTLTTGPGGPPRSWQDLAPNPDNVPEVIAAVHHAVDAVALFAVTEHHQVRGAAQAGRLLVPTRSLPGDYDIPRPYAPAPPQHTAQLFGSYRDAARASRQATVAIGRAAQAAGAPSRILTTARDITATIRPATPVFDVGERATTTGQPEEPAPPGPLQHTLHTLGVTDAVLLTRGADLDHASQRLLIDAADHLSARRPQPGVTLNDTAASAALLNHALATGHPQAAGLMRQPDQPKQASASDPEPEP
jgi:hypothetical protein